jgi:hypothetical protein
MVRRLMRGLSKATSNGTPAEGGDLPKADPGGMLG